MPRYHVFLSHAGAGKPAVEHLAHKLRAEGLEPFLDRWHLIPGEPWQEALEEALDQSRTCAVFLGKEVGPWQNEEMRSALAARIQDGGFRVIPVLLPGGREPGKEELPRFLRRLTWVDFRSAGLDDEDTFRRLVAGIQGLPPGPGPGGGGASTSGSYRYMGPAREPFVQRSEYGKVRDALLLEGAPTVGITTAIYGAGGFGKTALAIELCHDEQVREHYPDGILWATLGEEIDDAGRLARVRDLIRGWTDDDPPAFETVLAASAHLRKELTGKRVLLVVDDVWRPEDVTPFHGLGPRAALLVTTRDSRTLPGEAVPIHVDAMEIPEAVRLLGAGLPTGREADLQKLAARLGEWPLLLKIVHRQLRELIQRGGLSLEQSLREVNEALDAEGLTVFDREDLESRNQAVARTLGASLRWLSGEEVGRFEQLAIFPEDKDIPLLVLEKLWDLGSFATKKLCGHLHDLSLLLRFDRPAGTIRLHDVIRAYLLKRGVSHLAEWHRCLLDAFRPASRRWPDLPREESYLWNHLIHHLIGAGESDVGRNLLLELRYLQSKLEATDINALLIDCSPFVEKQHEVRLLRDALRLSAHVLDRNPRELSGQLRGRLLDRQEVGIQYLLGQTISLGIPWLRLRMASLTRPGEALIRSIEHPGLPPTSFAVLPGGRLISGSFDGKLRLWDVESGQILQTLEGHRSVITTLAVLDSRRLVSGSDDGTLRVWDVENGITLQTLELPYSSGIRAAAVLDSRRLLSGSDDGILRVWDAESGKALQSFEVSYSNGIRAVAVLDRRRVILGSDTLEVWDVDRGRALKTLDRQYLSVLHLAVLDGCRVVSGSRWNGALRVWDVESGNILQTFEEHSGAVSALAVLDSQRVVSGFNDGTLRVWDVESGQTLAILQGHSREVSAVTMFDSRRLVSGSEDGTLRLWNVGSSQAIQRSGAHSGRVHAMAVLDSHRVVSGSSDKTLRVWDVESGQTLQTLEGHSGMVHSVAVFGGCWVVSGSSDKTLKIWDLESGQILQTFEGHSREVNFVAVLDSRQVVSCSAGILQVWDLESGKNLRTFLAHAVAVLDSGRVVSGSYYDGTLRVWDLESGETLQTLEGLFNWDSTVTVLDNGRVVSGSYDGTLCVWDLESGETLQTLEGHSDRVHSVAVLDRCRLVSGSSDETLRVWDVESGKIECLFTLDAPVTAVAVMPDRRTIVAGDSAGGVHFFDFVEP